MKISNALDWLSKPKNLWITMFLYTILTGLFVQLILLPYIVPSWHAGNGLIKGVDGPKFHNIALELTQAIKSLGWNQWIPTPSGQLVSGVAAIFYVFIYPKPWSVLPLNALLNASACVCMFLIMDSTLKSPRKAVIASLPFLFFPSNLLWNTQFHNENYAIPGVILILYGWMLIIKNGINQPPIQRLEVVKAIVSVLLGSFLLGLVRLYILSGMTYLFVVVWLVIGITWFLIKNKVVNGRDYLRKLLIGLLLWFIMFSTIAIIQLRKLDKLNVFGASEVDRVKLTNKWGKPVWLPNAVIHQLQDLAKYRRKFVSAWEEGGSSIDLDVTYNNPTDMILYIPRAIQIAFLSPFPNSWFSEGKKASGSAMRSETAFEMLFIYCCLVGLPFFIWKNRTKTVVWMLMFVCSSMLIIYAMIVPNVGALYRFRYPYLMPLVCLGLAGWLSMFEKKRFPQMS